MFDTVILDWSGTLVDDLAAVLHGTNQVFRDLGLPVLSRDEFRRTFDLPVRAFYDRHLPDVPLERIDRSFFQGFREVALRVAPFPFTLPFLEEASRLGVPLQILTTLDVPTAERLLEEFGWHRYFDEVHAGVEDKIPYLVRLVRDRGMDPARTVFVGDLPHDIAAGRRAGIRACGVLSGYATRERLEASKPDLLLEDVGRLTPLLDGRGEAAETPSPGSVDGA